MPLSNTDTNSPSITSPTPPELVPSAVPSAVPLTPPDLVYPEPLSAHDAAAYVDLRRESAWFESAGQWSTFRGPKAAEALNGLITNDVSLLQPGEGMHAAALTPKGKVLCDMLVFRLDEETFMLTLLRTGAPQWLATARKYVNPRLAKVEDESDKWSTWMLYGPQASKAVAALGAADQTVEDLGDVMMQGLAEWKPWQHGLWNIGPTSVRLIRAPLMGSTPGFIIMADARDADVVRDRLETSACRHATRAVWDIARVESGRPAFGIDMDDNTIPQEANLDTLGAISFTKGCYTGQETVARIHFRGHVNRRLRGLLGSSALPQHGQIVDATGKLVGDVRSTVISPRLGPIAIAMLRREVSAGDTVIVEGTDGPITAEVRELPFAE
ncbi:YgfZ/GcvT domain-containing protein [Gemmatimonas sp.]|uniref:CAF17-like 4Fe-4S cluster assembly/insertion protein YgfZ n=1 Tax=Gemmatimonas sp. TaxID=1962908 RepID=UPI0037C06530